MADATVTDVRWVTQAPVSYSIYISRKLHRGASDYFLEVGMTSEMRQFGLVSSISYLEMSSSGSENRAA